MIDTSDIKIFSSILREEYDERARRFKDSFVWKDTLQDHLIIVEKGVYELPAFDFRMIAHTFYQKHKRDTLLFLINKKEISDLLHWEIFVARTSNPLEINNSAKLVFTLDEKEDLKKSDKFKIQLFLEQVLKDHIDITLITDDYEDVNVFFKSMLNGKYEKYFQNRHVVLSKKEAKQLFIKTPLIEAKETKNKRKLLAFGVIAGAIITFVLLNLYVVDVINQNIKEEFAEQKKSLNKLIRTDKVVTIELTKHKEDLKDDRGISYDN